MSKIIRQIKILVSCPKDVENIKDLIEECCKNFNPAFSKNESLEFAVIHWKKSVNAIMTGERPQDIINKEFKAQEYDIFIGIFWKRFGEKQSNGKTPTEEEYEIALSKHKKNQRPYIVKVYFKQDPTILPEDGEEILQLAEIIKFKKRIQNEGLYVGFNENTFRDLFYRELLEFSYLFRMSKKILTNTNRIDYKLPQGYLKRRLIKRDDFKKYNFISDESLENISVDLVKRNKRTLILGDAGIGKTTEINFIANYYSNADEGLIPIFIKLKNYVDQDVEDFLNTANKEIMDENLLLLFDGFDEVESKNKMTLIRKILFYEEQHPNVNIVITSRKNAYNNELNNFEVYYLLNLNNEDIENFISRIQHD